MKSIQFDFLNVLKKLQYSKVSRNELNFLIKTSYQISYSFLISRYKSNLQFLDSEDRQLEDIAMDAIVPLFIKNKSNKIGIITALNNWDSKISSVTDANYFLSRIIWRRVDQTVTKVLKDKDPIFEKILKTLNICIANNSYKKQRYFGSVYVLENKEANIFGEIIDEDNFNQIPEFYFGLKQAELFNKIFQYIITNTNFYPAVPLNLLVKRVKYYHSRRLSLHLSTDNHKIDQEISLNEIISTCLFSVKTKLDKYYVSRNKISTEEAKQIYKAFGIISRDLLNGGMNDSLYSYLNDQNRKISRELFYKKYHPIMNYLFFNFKKSVATKIEV